VNHTIELASSMPARSPGTRVFPPINMLDVTGDAPNTDRPTEKIPRFDKYSKVTSA